MEGTYLFGPMFYAEYPINIGVVNYTVNLRRSAAPPLQQGSLYMKNPSLLRWNQKKKCSNNDKNGK